MNALDLLQEVNDFLFSLFGLNSVTLEIQIYINKRRNERDIHDPKEIIVTDENFDYIQ